jgi:hypothetical protein
VEESVANSNGSKPDSNMGLSTLSNLHSVSHQKHLLRGKQIPVILATQETEIRISEPEEII